MEMSPKYGGEREKLRIFEKAIRICPIHSVWKSVEPSSQA
jgi:hypothetical protein